MEVGAVKQAFNNEIILLKKNLNQAKIQTIHKLTRKAKTLTEKKAPDTLMEKLKRKAESAVKEVLIIKKIKPRDIARFIVTHTGKLNDYLNKPTVDNDKACARLLLHKAMQEKYKLIRGKFSNISIKDLFMSRQERLKLKKEAKEKQKNKKKGKKSEAVNVEGEWDVEMTDTSKEKVAPDDTVLEEPNDVSDNDLSDDGGDDNINNDIISDDDVNDDNESNESIDDEMTVENSKNVSIDNDKCQGSESDDEPQCLMKPTKASTGTTKQSVKSSKIKLNIPKQKNISVKEEKSLKAELKKTEKKHKENKNKNLNEKLQKRKFNKESDDVPEKVSKIVDPFFITSSGENYMSLVEPRQPDEVKEVHKEGNRRHRRAVMFGHEPKIKPKRHFEPKNNFNKQNNYTNNNNDFNEQNKFTNNNKIKFNSQNSFKKEVKVQESVPEKLHPSWEAKKKQSGIVPFKGKKIVFDES
ncbi:unnamed protein product, partial [Brenthis ino]